eukprot:30920-Pelagococcus_subviridis.AAC.9
MTTRSVAATVGTPPFWTTRCANEHRRAPSSRHSSRSRPLGPASDASFRSASCRVSSSRRENVYTASAIAPRNDDITARLNSFSLSLVARSPYARLCPRCHALRLLLSRERVTSRNPADANVMNASNNGRTTSVPKYAWQL